MTNTEHALLALICCCPEEPPFATCSPACSTTSNTPQCLRQTFAVAKAGIIFGDTPDLVVWPSFHAAINHLPLSPQCDVAVKHGHHLLNKQH